MRAQRMWKWVVAFDVADDRRRRAVGRVLADCGDRVQRSVFECWLRDNQLAEIRGRLTEVLDARADQVHWYRLCEICEPLSLRLGTAPDAKDDPFFLA